MTKTIVPVRPVKRDWMMKLRSEKKMTIREIAENFGISHTHYSDIEKGKRNPSVDLSIEMAEFFNVPLVKLLKERTKFGTE